jgi:hypothetical protein
MTERFGHKLNDRMNWGDRIMLKKFAFGTAIVLMTASASLAATQIHPRSGSRTVYNPAPIVEICHVGATSPQCRSDID